MRHSLRSNRLEAVSLDAPMVRVQEQAMERFDDCRFVVHRWAITSRDWLAAFVDN